MLAKGGGVLTGSQSSCHGQAGKVGEVDLLTDADANIGI